MIGVPNEAYRTYGKLEEVVEQHGKEELIGRDVTRPHFMSIEGVEGDYHRLIEFVGDYRYDNVICATFGGSNTFFVERQGSLKRVAGELRPIKIPDEKSPDFILIRRNCKKYLYHIPSGTTSDEAISSREKVRMMSRGLFDIREKDVQIEWTGGSFSVYKKEDTNEPSGETEKVELMGEEWNKQKMDMREAYKYQSLLDKIVREVSYIENREEAKMFLNGNIELNEDELFKNKYKSIRQSFSNGMMDMQEFEEELNNLLEKHEESLEEQLGSKDEYGDSDESGSTDGENLF